jgi:uncharacterized membrane protein YhaH (DUF805 family)
MIGGVLEQGGLMGFDDAIKLGFANYVNFSGRSEYWYWVLFVLIGQLASGVIDSWIVGAFILESV